MKALKKVLISASVGAIVAAAGMSAALATPVFTINPTSIVPAGSAFQASDFSYYSNATIVQSAPGVQQENGYAYLTGYSNNGSTIDPATSRMVSYPYAFAPAATTYGSYLTYTATVSGVNGFGPTAGVGTITSFSFNMYADMGLDDTFNPGNFTTTAVGGNTGNDILLAHGSLLVGSAGFQAATGAPTFATVDFFTVDDPAYFTAPVPFYQLVLTSTTAGSAQNVTTNNADPAIATAATLNGITGTANFIPEPLTLSVFGAGLFGAAALRRRKSKKA